MELIRLLFEFFKVGLFAIGGGLATIPFLQEMSVNTGWFTLQQLADMVAISESTPGPIGINMASYVGYLTAGVNGEIVATLGIITPSIIIILLIAKFLKSFKNNEYVKSAFYSMRPASSALIASATLSLIPIVFFTKSIINVDNIKINCVVLFVVLFLLIKKYNKIHPACFIIIAAIAGVIFQL